ncbi:hypothetical protein BS78_05G176800 [Paspalum vaginatum]|nr:hypothetical protein BS78_05G176800 [Paspalum vaginatum]
MLPGVEIARRRRVHYHGDAAAKSSAGAGEHHHHHHYAHAQAHHAGVAGPALAARIRLEERLRGAALPPPPTSPSSRWSRLMRHSQHQSRQQQDDQHQLQVQAQEQQAQPSPPGDPASTAAATRRRRAQLTRTLSKVDVCAVCLEEVRVREERVTRLPCSHKYHSDCVLPWLAIQPDCPCCRALVPSAAQTLLIP